MTYDHLNDHDFNHYIEPIEDNDGCYEEIK